MPRRLGNESRLTGVLIALGVFWAVVVMPVTAPASDGQEHLESRLDFEIKPSKLPRSEPAQVWTEIATRYRTGDGSHLPAAKALRFGFDRHLELDLKGVPGCKLPTLQPRLSPGEIESICRESIVGRGEISVEVEFPDQPKTVVDGRMVLVRVTDSSTGIDLVAHTFLSAPVTAEVVTTVDVRRANKGRIGWEAEFSIPKIAGAYGSLTEYTVRFGKRLLSATCVDERLELRAVTVFANGSRRSGHVSRPCVAVAEADPRQ